MYTLITGATGMVGGYLAEKLADKGEKVIVVGRSKDSLIKKYGNKVNIICLSNEELFGGKDYKISRVVHCAFTRTGKSQEIVSSLDFAKKLAEYLKSTAVSDVFYLSSRSIYEEPAPGTLNTENSAIAPRSMLAMAKYATELIFQSVLGNEKCCMLRVSSVNEVKIDNIMKRPLNVFATQAFTGQDIKIIGGSQLMAYADVRDVVDAIEAVMALPAEKRNPYYNIGNGEQYDLLSLAKLVCRIAEEQYGCTPVNINVEPSDVQMSAGLDISQITADTGWTPKYSIEDMIISLFENLKNGYEII